MLKILYFLSLLILLLSFLKPNVVNAASDPSSTTNNKFGIHITDESDIKNAASLVNSSGGDWGYVTFVIRSDERDSKRWQNFFDELRVHHLIPIVRIASKQGDGYWEKLNIDEIDGWVSFLGSLNWVVQNRYVIVGNEVNLGHEWGGKSDAKEYTDYYVKFSEKLKNVSQDFFIMPSALDSSAKTTNVDTDEQDFLMQMTEHNKDVFRNIDGLATHSYPYKNLGDNGDKATLRHYEWELSQLKKLGIDKTLPVFITETGWMHGNGYMNERAISESLVRTIRDVWQDTKIVAITPFILNYKTPPFEHYSWMDINGHPYNFFREYQNTPKLKGVPFQVQSGEVVSYMVPRFVRTKFNNVYGFMYIKNTGQTIWEGYVPITLIINGKRTQIKPITILSDVKPGDKTLAVYSINEVQK